MKLILTVVLMAIILVCLSLSAVKIIRSMKKTNPNATIIPAPQQENFEPHPEWSGDSSEKQDS